MGDGGGNTKFSLMFTLPHNNRNLYWGVVRGVYPPFKTKLNTIRDPHNNRNLYWGVVRGVYPPFKTKLNTIGTPSPLQTQRVLPHRN